jgi:hypothetical protein
MAGAFGFEAEHYDTSLKVGELMLLPAARAAAKDTILIADGFSCREQVRQTTDRVPMHLSEVIQMGLRGDTAGEFPERNYVTAEPKQPSLLSALSVIAGCALLTGIVLRVLAASRPTKPIYSRSPFNRWRHK